MVLAGDDEVAVQGLATMLLAADSVDLVDVATFAAVARPGLGDVCDVLVLAPVCTDESATTVVQVVAQNPRLGIVVHETGESGSRLRTLVGCGVQGFVGPGGDQHDLEDAIRTVRSGQAWLCRSVARRILDLAASMGDEPGPIPSTAVLTDREREIADLAVTGLSNGDIAERLVVTGKTVKFHISNIFRKYGVTSRARMVLAHRGSTRWHAAEQARGRLADPATKEHTWDP